MTLLPSRWTRAAATGATVGIIWVTVATVAGELSAPFKDWLKAVFAHHWLGKGYVAAGIFILVLLIASRQVDADGRRTNKSLSLLMWVTTAGALLLAGFFAYELLME